jgi:DNA replication protein DnaC
MIKVTDVLQGIMKEIPQNIEVISDQPLPPPPPLPAIVNPVQPDTLTESELQQAVQSCGVCHGIGYVRYDLGVRSRGFGELTPCPACRAYTHELQERQHQAREVQRLGRTLARYQMLTGDLLEKTFKNFQAGICDAARDAVRQWVAGVLSGKGTLPWVYLYGTCGNGKTHLAAAAANALVARQRQVLFATWPQLLGMAAADVFKDKEGLIVVFQKHPVLIIDDLKADDLGLDWQRSILFRLLDWRYVRRSPTLLVSNLPLTNSTDSLERYDRRCASRIGDVRLTAQIFNPAPDFRKQA